MFQYVDKFLNDETAAVTLDWHVLTLSIFGVYAMFGLEAKDIAAELRLVDMNLPAHLNITQIASAANSTGLVVAVN